MKIDTHIHLYDPQAGDFDWPEPGSPIYRKVLPPDFKEQGAPLGVTGAVVIACSTMPEQTELILNTMHDSPEVAAVIGYCHADDPKFIEMHDRFSRFSKFRGFRFLCTEAPGEQAMKNAAYVGGKQADVLEFLGSVEGIAKMKPLIEANPNVTFVIEHFARTQTDAKTAPEEYVQFLEEMAGYPNVYLKISALIPLAAADPAPKELSAYLPVLEASFRVFGEDRCMFGSDWPLLELKGDYATAVRITEEFLASKSQTALDKVMGQNARRVYKL